MGAKSAHLGGAWERCFIMNYYLFTNYKIV